MFDDSGSLSFFSCFFFYYFLRRHAEGKRRGRVGRHGGGCGRQRIPFKGASVPGRQKETVGEVRGGDQRPVEESQGLVGNLRFCRGSCSSLRRRRSVSPRSQGQNKFSSLTPFLLSAPHHQSSFLRRFPRQQPPQRQP